MDFEQEIIRQPKNNPPPSTPKSDKGGYIISSVIKTGFVDDQQRLGSHGGPQRKKKYQLVLVDFRSVLIDFLCVMFFSLIVIMVSYFLSSKMMIDRNVRGFIFAKSHLVFLFVSTYAFTSWVYLVFTRLVHGATIGEMTNDVRLGLENQFKKQSYYSQVFIRATLIVLSGYFVFPILALLTKKDLLGQITGLFLYQRK